MHSAPSRSRVTVRRFSTAHQFLCDLHCSRLYNCCPPRRISLISPYCSVCFLRKLTHSAFQACDYALQIAARFQPYPSLQSNFTPTVTRARGSPSSLSLLQLSISHHRIPVCSDLCVGPPPQVSTTPVGFSSYSLIPAGSFPWDGQFIGRWML